MRVILPEQLYQIRRNGELEWDELGRQAYQNDLERYSDLVVFSRFEPRPWVGLVLPENQTKAVIRRALLKETTTDELVELLLLSARYFGVCSFYADSEACKILAVESGLQNP